MLKNTSEFPVNVSKWYRTENDVPAGGMSNVTSSETDRSGKERMIDWITQINLIQ